MLSLRSVTRLSFGWFSTMYTINAPSPPDRSDIQAPALPIHQTRCTGCSCMSLVGKSLLRRPTTTTPPDCMRDFRHLNPAFWPLWLHRFRCADCSTAWRCCDNCIFRSTQPGRLTQEAIYSLWPSGSRLSGHLQKTAPLYPRFDSEHQPSCPTTSSRASRNIPGSSFPRFSALRRIP